MRRRSALAGALALALLLAACSDEGGDEETFCAKVREFDEGTDSFDLNVADEAEIERVATLLDEIRDAAPREIRDDVETRFAYVDDVIAASQGDTEAAQRLAEAEPTDEAQERIDAFTQETCGITLEPGGPSTTPAPPLTTVPPPPTTGPPTTVPPTTVAASTPPTTTSRQ